jgi:hypothetical protein
MRPFGRKAPESIAKKQQPIQIVDTMIIPALSDLFLLALLPY